MCVRPRLQSKETMTEQLMTHKWQHAVAPSEAAFDQNPIGRSASRRAHVLFFHSDEIPCGRLESEPLRPPALISQVSPHDLDAPSSRPKRARSGYGSLGRGTSLSVAGFEVGIPGCLGNPLGGWCRGAGRNGRLEVE